MSWGCIARCGIRADRSECLDNWHRAIAATKPAAVPPSRNVADRDRVEGAEWHAGIDSCGPQLPRPLLRRGSASKLPDRLCEL